MRCAFDKWARPLSREFCRACGLALKVLSRNLLLSRSCTCLSGRTSAWVVYETSAFLFFLVTRLVSKAFGIRIIYPHSYPQFAGAGGTDEDLMEILKYAHLAYIPAREGGWDTVKEWKDVLSGGEKQRVRFE